MCSRHRAKVNGVCVFAISKCAIALIISKAVLDANDNPDRSCQLTIGEEKNLEDEGQYDRVLTHQRFVKTTPNPKATKNKSGELVGPGLLLLLFAALDEADGAAEVEVGFDILTKRFSLGLPFNKVAHAIKRSEMTVIIESKHRFF